MSLSTLIFMGAVFVFFYKGVGLLLDSRQRRRPAFPGSAATSPSAALREWTGRFSRMGFNAMLLRNPRFRGRLDLMLMRSGHVFGWKAADLLFWKEAGALAAAALLWMNAVRDPLVWVLALGGTFMLPEVFVKSRAQQRQADIQRQLPSFVDLMALALESGLDFMAAVDRVISKMKPHALREELQMLIQENRLGTPRKDSLQHLAHRSGVADVQSLCAMIIQSEELGTSLATVLRAYAEDMRSRRIMKAEELAGKAPVKLLFPMVVFFFPIVFVIIFGPLAFSMINGYK